MRYLLKTSIFTVRQSMLAQQQNPSNQQRPPMPGQMPGLGQNPSMSPMPSGGPSPVSPLGQQSPLVSQTQQMSAQSPQSGMYPFNNQGHGAPGVDPRMASSNFTPQMPGNMNAMNMNQQQQQQRQLMLMQQQMRNNGVNMNAPNLMNQQQAYAMQQRMPQGGPSQVGGSPMSAPANDTFPALRSNSTIPGIARSGRSPSESVHSPMTPRAPSRLSSQPPMQPEDYQRAMSQQAQQSMMNAPQNSGSFHPQMQYHQWQNGQQQQQQQHQQQHQQQQQQLSLGGQMNGFGMSPQGGSAAGNSSFGGSISPSGPNWQQQGMNGFYPQANQRPQNMSGASMQQNISPVGDTTGVGEYDIFNWNGQ